MTPTIVSMEGLHLQIDTQTGEMSLEQFPENVDLISLGGLIADDLGEVHPNTYPDKEN